VETNNEALGKIFFDIRDSSRGLTTSSLKPKQLPQWPFSFTAEALQIMGSTINRIFSVLSDIE
jgi:hypothetical protein